MGMKTSIVIVTYQSGRYIAPLLASIRAQTLPAFEVLIVDNASTDDTLELVKKTLPSARIFPQTENLWFSKGYNVGIREAKGDWILVCNHDIVLEPTFLERLSRGQRLTKHVGSLCGKLLKMEKNENGLPLIDSAGMQVLRSRRMIDRGEGDEDRGQYENTHQVFGGSGALVCYRRVALEEVALPLPDGRPEYFDEMFTAYKEDIDLSWRLQQNAWKSVYVHDAIAHHWRSAARKTDLSTVGTLKNRKGKTPLIHILSYRNHLWALVKNDDWSAVLYHLPWIFVYELEKLFYILLVEQRTLLAVGSFVKGLPAMIRKRRLIRLRRRVTSWRLREWLR
jgi:GT2 family glycosyltransferase